LKGDLEAGIIVPLKDGIRAWRFMSWSNAELVFPNLRSCGKKRYSCGSLIAPKVPKKPETTEHLAG